MMFEYKVISAPKKGLRGKGVRGSEDRFANALMEVMNDLGAEGWEYQRTDTLPVEARSGLTGKATQFQNMMVFRREKTDGLTAAEATPIQAIDAADGTADDAVDTVPENNAPLLSSPNDMQSTPEVGTIMPTPKIRD